MATLTTMMPALRSPSAPAESLLSWTGSGAKTKGQHQLCLTSIGIDEGAGTSRMAIRQKMVQERMDQRKSDDQRGGAQSTPGLLTDTTAQGGQLSGNPGSSRTPLSTSKSPIAVAIEGGRSKKNESGRLDREGLLSDEMLLELFIGRNSKDNFLERIDDEAKLNELLRKRDSLGSSQSCITETGDGCQGDAFGGSEEPDYAATPTAPASPSDLTELLAAIDKVISREHVVEDANYICTFLMENIHMIGDFVDFVPSMQDYPHTPKFVCGNPVLFLYKPFRRQVRKDNMQWVDGAPVLVLLLPKARSMPASSTSDDDGKDAEKRLHFGGREHRVTPRTVLQHGGDHRYLARRYQLIEPKPKAKTSSTSDDDGKDAEKRLHFGGREHRVTPRTVLQHGGDHRYLARRYQLIEPKPKAKTSSTSLFTFGDVLAQVSRESIKSTIESGDQDKKRSFVEAIGHAVFGDTIFGGDTAFNQEARRKYRSPVSLEAKFGKLAVGPQSLQDEAAHGASVEGLVDECLKMVARSWSEPISESVLDELNRALQEIKKANDDQ